MQMALALVSFGLGLAMTLGAIAYTNKVLSTANQVLAEFILMHSTKCLRVI